MGSTKTISTQLGGAVLTFTTDTDKPGAKIQYKYVPECVPNVVDNYKSLCPNKSGSS